MQTLTHFNRASILVLLSLGLSGLQSLLLHLGTTDAGHPVFSLYFFLELLILLLVLLSGLKQKVSALLFLLLFALELLWFFINERPISPDLYLMLGVGAIRVYVVFWLYSRLVKNGEMD